jgi:ketosteroid isomerase-like protein
MKWILIASVLSWQPAYNDKETCQLAAEELKKVYYQEVAACIPKPSNTAESEEKVDRMFDQFMNMVKELQAIEQKELDKSSK